MSRNFTKNSVNCQSHPRQVDTIRDHLTGATTPTHKVVSANLHTCIYFAIIWTWLITEKKWQNFDTKMRF